MRTLVLVVLRRILSTIGGGRTLDATEVEIAVLRHQLAVVRGRSRGLAHAGRPDGPGRVGEAAPAGSVEGLGGHFVDAAALAR
jgi:hypothetical protein